MVQTRELKVTLVLTVSE